MPHAGWGQGQVVDPSAIDGTAQRKESGLPFLFGSESTRDHETAGLLPAVMTMLEVGHLPITMRGFIAQPGEQVPGKLGSKGQRPRIGPNALRALRAPGRRRNPRRPTRESRGGLEPHWQSKYPATRCCPPRCPHSRGGVRCPRGKKSWPRRTAMGSRVASQSSAGCS